MRIPKSPDSLKTTFQDPKEVSDSLQKKPELSFESKTHEYYIRLELDSAVFGFRNLFVHTDNQYVMLPESCHPLFGVAVDPELGDECGTFQVFNVLHCFFGVQLCTCA